VPRLRTLAAAAAAAIALAAAARSGRPPFEWRPGPPRDVRVLRDSWGVPHVFGRTDADAAFGLAYAHAEDDFGTIQAVLLAARGRLASVLGPRGAANDYLVALLRIDETVDSQYASALAPETRAICEAYADGLNLYAARHPREVLPGIFPARGRDVVAGFVHKIPLFFDLPRTLRELLDPRRPHRLSRRGERTPATPVSAPDEPRGSNAFAIAPSRSADGWTRLVVNSHQPWEGPVAWYEAHVRSEEGWDAVGGLFPGAPVILHGHNRRLGWAHTVNFPDLVDIYVLDVDPEDPGRYRFDGAWRRLESRTAAIEVKLLGPLRWTFHREALWSVHGPVLRTPHGTYAIRIAGLGEVRQLEAWYRMNKAASFDEWLSALRPGVIPMMNCVYADALGHVAYLYNARLPLRRDDYDWSGYLPGDTAETLWTDYLPFDRLPLVVDPPSGFVQSCNGAPFRATAGAGNADASEFPTALGIENRLTNRTRRALELLGADASITREELESYKFDLAYSAESSLAARFRRLLAVPAPADAETQQALAVLRRWDMRADPSNRAAALALLTLEPRDHDAPSNETPATTLSRLRRVAAELRRAHGRIDPPLADVQRLRRGPVDLGLGGGPDLLRAVYTRPEGEGRRVGIAGDSYLMFVEWDPEGRVRSRSIQPYGSATRRPRSPHYSDQAPLFARQELKPVWMDEAEIRRHLEREYRISPPPPPAPSRR
jgi:penicillin amidase/acyl-homoserine-lactone acylase